MDKCLIHGCYRYGLHCAVGDERVMKRFMNTVHQMVKSCLRLIYLVPKITYKQN